MSDDTVIQVSDLSILTDINGKHVRKKGIVMVGSGEITEEISFTGLKMDHDYPLKYRGKWYPTPIITGCKRG